jgi:hypothetical protein
VRTLIAPLILPHTSSGPRPTLSQTTSRLATMGGTSPSCAFLISPARRRSGSNPQHHVPQHVVVCVLPHPRRVAALAEGRQAGPVG